YFYLKRFLDIFFSLMILLLVSPVILIVSLCIILDDGFPVIFRQVRVGKRGKTFTMWKFRSMPVIQKPKANEVDEYAAWVNGVPDSFVFKSSYPPNVRPLGKFLRKYSLDELPQLWNVIKGEMSLIGPRPEVPKIAQYYNHIQQDRLMVKPGITG